MSEETTVMKTCPRCKRILPLTDKYFQVAIKKEGKFHAACKECRNKRARELSAQRAGREENAARVDYVKDGMRKCVKCGKWLPCTLDYFDRHKDCAGGVRPTCKECRGYPYNTDESREKFRTAKETERRMYEQEVLAKKTKTCTRCGRELPATLGYFWGDVRKIDGLQATCIECKGSEFKPGRQHREVANETLPEGLRRCALCGKDFPLAEFREYQRPRAGGRVITAYSSYCKTCERVKTNDYNKQHPDVVRAAHIRRKEREGLETITGEEWREAQSYFGGRCAYCGKELPLEMDHLIPTTRGGRATVDNIVPACRSCNSSKGAKPFREWFRSRPFYSEAREFQIIAYISAAGMWGTENTPPPVDNSERGASVVESH